MKMRANLGNRRQPRCKLFRNDTRLQRAKPDPFDSVHPGNFPHKVQQISPFHSRPTQIFSAFQIIAVRLINKVHTVGTDMNAGKNDLFIPFPCKPPDFPQNILLLPAAHPSPGIGDDAIGAKLITAILNFDICPGTQG